MLTTYFLIYTDMNLKFIEASTGYTTYNLMYKTDNQNKKLFQIK